jgi:VanZ family protein
MRRRLWLWGPVVLQMGIIFAASSIPNLHGLPGGTPDWLGHGVGYALLGGLALRALSGGRLEGMTARGTAAAIAFAALYGITDEFHQAFVPGRSPDAADLAADTAGAVLATVLLLVARFIRQSRRRAVDRRSRVI